jgi:hypothetical protein
MPASTSIIVAWANADTVSFENHVPLKWVGKRNRELGSKNNITVVFLEGMERLSAQYLAELTSLGYTIVDAYKSYQRYSDQLLSLNRFGDYEKKCFLRWLVIEELFGTGRIIHYDGDIVFNEIPERIDECVAPYNFVLQGCPAVVSIINRDWFKCYKNELYLFVKDIVGYSNKAWEERAGYEISWKQSWAGSRYRKIIHSDQDLISHLIHTRRIPQDSPALIIQRMNEYGLVFFDNPLYMIGHLHEMRPLKYRRAGKLDFINDKKVAIWHMQGNFIQYLDSFINRGILNRITRCGNRLEGDYLAQAEYYFFYLLARIHLIKKLKRSDVYRYFFEEQDLSRILSPDIFWKPGYFI